MQSLPPISGPLSLGELLDRSIRLYRKRFGTMLLTGAILVVPYAVLSGLLTGRVMTSYFGALQSLTAPPGSPDFVLQRVMPPVFSMFGGMMLVGLIGMVLLTLANLALIYHGVQGLHGNDLSIGDSYRRARQSFWPYVGMQILQTLALFGLVAAVMLFFLLAVGLISFGLYAGIERMAPDSGAGAGAGIFVLLICGYLIAVLAVMAPVFYLAARWFVAAPCLVVQRLGPVEALRAAWRLSKGYAWRCFGYLFLLSILGLVVASIPAAIVQQLILVFFPADLRFYTLGLSSALTSLFNLFWMPIYATASVLLYYDLRVRRESYDLTLRLEKLEAEVGAHDGGVVDQ